MTYGLTNEGGRADAAPPERMRHPPARERMPHPQARTAGGGEIPGAAAENFEKVLVGELIPYVDANFRTLSDQPHRAMAGLSMGGMETKIITLKNLDKFSHIGFCSAAASSTRTMSTTPRAGRKSKSCSPVAAAARTPGNIKANHEALNGIGLQNTACISPDTAHEFQTWRRSLREFGPLLFRD